MRALDKTGTGLMSNKDKISIFDAWNKYEDIAMHFNDLLIKLRTQALGGIAAITSIMAIISKDSSGFNWGLMMGVFFFLIIFWIAVWLLDSKYYNPLLVGAVDAILEIEKLSKTESTITELNLSHKIKDAVSGKIGQDEKKSSSGKKWYYCIVFLGLVLGFGFSLCMMLYEINYLTN